MTDQPPAGNEVLELPDADFNAKEDALREADTTEFPAVSETSVSPPDSPSEAAETATPAELAPLSPIEQAKEELRHPSTPPSQHVCVTVAWGGMVWSGTAELTDQQLADVLDAIAASGIILDQPKRSSGFGSAA
jgi:hypothetical protein